MNASVLEIGPGQTSDIIIKLAKYDRIRNAFAIDIIDYFGKTFWNDNGVNYINSDLSSIARKSIDFAYCYDVLEHVKNPVYFLKELRNILVTLDATEDIIEEAINKGCNLIVSYHPIIFDGIKKISEQDYVQKAIVKAIENKIAIYAIHTSMDNHPNGISYSLAKIVGLNKTSILIPKGKKVGNLKIGMGTIGFLKSRISEEKFLDLVKKKVKNIL